MSQIVTTLQDWCESCETVLACIEEQIRRANSEKQRRLKHKDVVEQEVNIHIFFLSLDNLNAIIFIIVVIDN